MFTEPLSFADLCVAKFGGFLPDRVFLSLRYFFRFRKWMNWSSPETFNEKLQWLKLYGTSERDSLLVDKASVKEYVAKKIGEEYVIDTLAVWNSVDEIDWDSLPNQFVLKTTHSGGGTGVIVCRDKERLDRNQASARLKQSMGKMMARLFREKVYYSVPRRILAEKYISNPDGELNDYKFFCFNGHVKCFKIDFGRFVEHHANYYSPDCELLPFGEADLVPDPKHVCPMPENINEMIRLAEVLADEYPFVRVDLYNVRGKIYFGELTFYPAGGMGHFTDPQWDRTLGSWIRLPIDK